MLDFIVKRRAEQLAEQKDIDKKLSECPCQNLVAKYLLLQRKINRDQCQKVKDGGFLHTYTNIKQNLEEIDSEHVRINEVLNADNPCDKLKQYFE